MRSSREDVNQMAARIVGKTSGEVEATLEDVLEELERRLTGEQLHQLAATILGRKGGSKGGTVRASRLSPERRSEIAKGAAQARWGSESS